MNDKHTRDPIRELAGDAASDAVPIEIDPARTDFIRWTEAVEFVRGHVEAELRAEVEA